MKFRLFHKFIAAFFMIGLAAVTVAGLLIERELKADLTTRISEEMAAAARIIALMPAGEIAGHAVELAERTRARLTLIDAEGRVTADSDLGNRETDDHQNRSEIQEARLRGVGKAVRYSHTLQKEMLYVAIPLQKESSVPIPTGQHWMHWEQPLWIGMPNSIISLTMRKIMPGYLTGWSISLIVRQPQTGTINY